MHTLKVAILGGTVAPEQVDRWAAEKLGTIEPLRRRLAGPRWARPMWTLGRLDVADHVGHVELVPADGVDGNERSFVEFLGKLCGSPLDRSRPLWKLWHVRGAAPGRDALVLQVHHALADGAASAALWEAMDDRARTASVDERLTPAMEPTALAALRTGAKDVVALPRQLGRYARYLGRTGAMATAGEAGAAGPFLGEATPFNGKPEASRSCAFAVLPMERLQGVRARTGATVTEILLTLVGGAVARHLEALGEPIRGELAATVPAGLPERREPFGNSVTTLYVALGAGVDGPLERLGLVRRSLAGARSASDIDPRLLPDWQRYPRLYRGIYRTLEAVEDRRGRPAYHCIVSSVRGPEPLTILGLPVVQLRSLGPLSGRIGLNATGWTYGDEFVVGLHAYARAAPALDGLAPAIVAELGRLHDACADWAGLDAER